MYMHFTGTTYRNGHYQKNQKGEHSAIVSTVIELQLIVKIFVLSFLSDRLRQVLLHRLMQVKSIAECSKGSILQ